eukprot:3496212-Rhodomonas_salina.1
MSYVPPGMFAMLVAWGVGRVRRSDEWEEKQLGGSVFEAKVQASRLRPGELHRLRVEERSAE